MSVVDVALNVPEYIAQGIANGTYERVGGVVREAGSKQIVAWLREAFEKSEPAISNNLINSSANAVSNTLNLALSSVNAVSSVLNLAISTMGFIVVVNRLEIIKHQLKQSQDVLQAINYKIDLSSYADFLSALDSAASAFKMIDPENRRTHASQAITGFTKAERYYKDLTDLEIGKCSPIADKFLSTLCLAYVTEVCCYLELEELDLARSRLQEGAAELRPRFEKHINTLLTSNPAAYLHPCLKEQVGLKRLTKVYQWLQPGIDESDVFEMQRENLFNLAQEPKKWMQSLPPAIKISNGGSATPTKGFQRLTEQPKKGFGALSTIYIKSGSIISSQQAVTQSPEMNIYGFLPVTLGVMESIIEDDNRLTMYQSEVEMINLLGMSFHEWRQLTPPSSSQGNEKGLICITVS